MLKLFKNSSTLRLLALVYAVLFVVTGSLRHLPYINSPDGHTLGIFKLEWYDDLLHYGSGVWAVIAAWYSVKASINFFKIFGIIYGLDGVMGFFLGQGYLDLGIFLKGYTELDWGFKFWANIPHITIGATAVYIGYILSKKYPKNV